MIKEMVHTINEALGNGEMSINAAEKLLESLGVITSKQYRILNRRVVYIENGAYHDAFVNA